MNPAALASHLDLGAAWLGGLATSLSPCTLATLPLAVAYVGGAASGQPSSRARVATLALLFGVGHVLAFALVGAGVGQVARAMMAALPGWQALAGLILLALAALRLRGRPACAHGGVSRFERWARSGGALGALVLGAASAIVVTPCATAVLGALTALALGDFTAWHTTALFAAYAAGHMVVPMAAALAAGSAARWMPRLASAQLGLWVQRGIGLTLGGMGLWWLAVAGGWTSVA